MIVVTAAVALLVIVAAGLIWLVPKGSQPASPGGPSGVDQFGSAPGAHSPGRTGQPSPGSGSTTGAPAPGSTATGNPTPGANPGGAGASGAAPSGGSGGTGVGLAATYQVERGLVDTTISVRITNGGTATSDGWTVVMKLSGVPLSVKTSDGVSYQGSGGQLTFTPSGVDRAIPPGSELTFSYAVTGLLNGRVQTCTIDGLACGT